MKKRTLDRSSDEEEQDKNGKKPLSVEPIEKRLYNAEDETSYYRFLLYTKLRPKAK